MMEDAAAQPQHVDNGSAGSEPGREADLAELLHFIRDARGFDFSGYKRSTLTRRIYKRMHDVGIAGYLEYRDLLESSSEEFYSLFNTILINVTSFFRDPEAWRYLQRDVVPAILARTKPGDEIRVWSAGCASGEEAYSLAIAFSEVLGVAECIERVKIYGTDIDDEALREARAGVYSAKAIEPVPGKLRSKYFNADADKFAFRNDLRRRVIFGHHDITRDAPISRLDLLVCRNTLMYFNVEAQSHIIDRFHFALREGGFLFLGRAEMLLADGERFEVASMRQRVFRRRAGERVTRYQPVTALPLELRPIGRNISRRRQLNDLSLDATPTAVIVVGADDKVAVINGRARAQFGLTAHDVDRSFHELEVSYRPAELRSLIEQAHAERRTVRVGGVEHRLDTDEVCYFDVVVQPLRNSDGQVIGVALYFIDVTAQTDLRQEVRQTREDLETAYEELQSTNEELETTNEELQSSIEELETTNEELQSTNEELETTNEELQSGNDELERVNNEVRVRSAERDETRTFLEGVLASVAAGIVVLDAQLRVRTWNRGAEDLWGLRADEVHSRAFLDLEFGLPTEQLREIINSCASTGRRTGPTNINAVNRIGHAITCSVACSPLDGPGAGVVLLIEEAHRT